MLVGELFFLHHPHRCFFWWHLRTSLMCGGGFFFGCSGVPDGVAVGRRKGQSGANSLCGTCGMLSSLLLIVVRKPH